MKTVDGRINGINEIRFAILLVLPICVAGDNWFKQQVESIFYSSHKYRRE